MRKRRRNRIPHTRLAGSGDGHTSGSAAATRGSNASPGTADCSPYTDPKLLAGSEVPRDTDRLEGGINSPVKRVLDDHRDMPRQHMMRACEWKCYMRSGHPDTGTVLDAYLEHSRQRAERTERRTYETRRRPATSRKPAQASNGTNSIPPPDTPTPPTRKTESKTTLLAYNPSMTAFQSMRFVLRGENGVKKAGKRLVERRTT